jgi:ABC-2 type transport system ATP-binding protein
MITLQSVTKRFGTLTAVSDISLEVGRGSIFAFLGPNGAGKTTTIRMLTTTLAPTSGVILLGGLDVGRSPAEARRNFGIVFQDPSLDLELTATENLTLHGILYGMPRYLRNERIEQLLRFVGLWDRRNAFPKTFSGGMKRRLEIARALLHAPAVLVLDEPTLGLDPQTRAQIWDYITARAREDNTTVFFTTHYMEEAERVADSVAVIDHGRLVAVGSPSELRMAAGAPSLEEAFIKFTGRAARDDGSSESEAHMRTYVRVWGRR